MAYQIVREKARLLRKHGESIGAIALALKMNKSTVGYWCRDIVLSRAQFRRLIERQQKAGAVGRARAAEIKRSNRIKATLAEEDRGRQDVNLLTKRDVYMLGLALYWGEGYKSGNEECGVTNSDPDIIRAFILWLRRMYNIHIKDLILRVSVNHVHKARISAIEQYWSEATRVPRKQFTKASLIKSTARKIYANPEKHFGTLRVKVRRATALRRRILGSIKEVRRQIIRSI